MLVVGINYGSGHDSSAAVAVDGEVRFAVAEERLSRAKHDGGFPVLAIKACLAHTGASLGDAQAIICGWQTPGAILAQDAKDILTGSHPKSLGNAARFIASQSLNAWRSSGERALSRHFGSTRNPLARIDHHFAHALSTYAVSGFDQAAI